MTYINTKLGSANVNTLNPPKGVGPSDVWWRAEDRRYANYDPWAEFEQPCGSHLVIELTPYVLARATPRGVWLRGFLTGEFFVLGDAIRQRAVPTKELALRDLVERKKVHVSGATARLRQAEHHLAAAQRALEVVSC